MEKRGSLVVAVIVIIFIISALSIIVWQSIKINNEKGDITEQENSNITTGGTDINEISANKTEEIDSENIPNPTGSVTFISREDSAGEYFCNKNESPVHAVRVYTYKIINGEKNLSEDYIESKKIKVCDDYNNESVTKGITYNIEWNWDAVDGVDGYKIYQYFYLNKNVSREYNNSRDIKTNKLLDTGLDLWE